MTSIKLLFMLTEAIQLYESCLALEEFYLTVKIVPGTQSHHSFVSVSSEALQIKHISADDMFRVINLKLSLHEFSTEIDLDNISSYKPGSRVIYGLHIRQSTAH